MTTSIHPVGPYHSAKSSVYHIYFECVEGNNIEERYWEGGKSKRRLCTRCDKISRGMYVPPPLPPGPPPRFTSPYRSKNSQVYHEFTDCVDGNNIEPKYLRMGDGNRRLCERCRQRMGGTVH